jgi:small subunit ribosomal protein S8
MSVTDPISDFLTIIRNGCHARCNYVDIPASKIKREITKTLLNKGYIKRFIVIDNGKQGLIRIWLKYDEEGLPVINMIKRVSTPGRRKYTGVKELPRVRNNLGIAIMTTPQGIMTSREATSS